VIEFVAPSGRGRQFSGQFRVRLGDADESGVIRLDGVAGILQDVATDDWEETGLESTDTWVVRRTTIRVADGGVGRATPRYSRSRRGAAAWVRPGPNVERTSPHAMDSQSKRSPCGYRSTIGHPVRIKPAFYDVYGEAMQGRKVSGRVPSPEVATARRRWRAASSRRSRRGRSREQRRRVAGRDRSRDDTGVVGEHHSPRGDCECRRRQHRHVPGSLWLVVDDHVRVAAEYAQ